LHELLREFAEYTPGVLIRLIADGATVVLLLMSNVVGVVLYALVIGSLLEKTTSLIGSILVRVWLRRWPINPQLPIGTLSRRIGNYLPIVAGNLLKAWIGLPVVYVLSLFFFDDRGSAEELGRLVSGYAWQEQAIAQIPLHTWLNLSHNSVLQTAVSLIVAFLYVNNVYVYYANGFFLARQLRVIGDLISSIAVGSGASKPTPEVVAAKLKDQRWTDEALKSALWFLHFRNMRIVWENLPYNKIGPMQYGILRAVISLTIILTLKELHPVVAALKFYFEKHDIGKMRRSMAMYNRNLAALPEPVRKNIQEMNSSG
jgi:hypothetical protein